MGGRHAAALGHLLIAARADAAAGAACDGDGELLLLRARRDGDLDRCARLDHRAADRILAGNGALLHVVIIDIAACLHGDAETLGRRLCLLERQADEAGNRDRGVLRCRGLLLRAERDDERDRLPVLELRAFVDVLPDDDALGLIAVFIRDARLGVQLRKLRLS